MAFDHMIHMAKEVVPERDGGLAAAAPAQAAEPLYPYNLSLSLTDEELEKLGLDCDDEDCQVGNYLHGHFLAEVTGVSKNKAQDGERRMLNLQITHLAVEDEDEENREFDEDEAYEGKIYRQAGPY